MPEFVVERIERHIHGVLVVADTPEEAVHLAEQGNYIDSLYFEYQDRCDSQDWVAYPYKQEA